MYVQFLLELPRLTSENHQLQLLYTLVPSYKVYPTVVAIVILVLYLVDEGDEAKMLAQVDDLRPLYLFGETRHYQLRIVRQVAIVYQEWIVNILGHLCDTRQERLLYLISIFYSFQHLIDRSRLFLKNEFECVACVASRIRHEYCEVDRERALIDTETLNQVIGGRLTIPYSLEMSLCWQRHVPPFDLFVTRLTYR